MERVRRVRSVEDLLATELGRFRDAVDLVERLRNFGLRCIASGLRGRAGVGGLDGEVTDTLQERVDLGECTFRRLHEADAVLRVAGSDLEATDLCPHAFTDAQAGSVVGGTVDTKAGRQFLEAFRHHVVVDGQVAVSVRRGDVLIDA